MRWTVHKMRAGSRKRRVYPRYPTRGEFRGNELPQLRSAQKSRLVRGKVKDISDGGFCILTAHAPKTSTLLQGQLRLVRMPVQVPTLVQVRWINRSPSGGGYKIGLQYVI